MKTAKSDEAKHLNKLGYSLRVQLETNIPTIEKYKDELETKYGENEKIKKELIEQEKTITEEVSKLNDQMRKKEGMFEHQVKVTDRLVDTLNIKLIRNILGLYQKDELAEEKKTKEKEKLLNDELKSKLESEICNIEKNLSEIPNRIADTKAELRDRNNKKVQTKDEINEYDDKESEIRKYFQLYGYEYNI